MKPIALARVRVSGRAQNICGISAETFSVPSVTKAGDQLAGVLDRITLLDNAVLFERAGHADVLIPLASIGPMTPLEDIRGELFDGKAPPKLEVPPEPVRPPRPVASRATPAVAPMRDDDGDELRPEAAITLPAAAVEAVESVRKKLSRGHKGPVE